MARVKIIFRVGEDVWMLRARATRVFQTSDFERRCVACGVDEPPLISCFYETRVMRVDPANDRDEFEFYLLAVRERDVQSGRGFYDDVRAILVRMIGRNFSESREVENEKFWRSLKFDDVIAFDGRPERLFDQRREFLVTHLIQINWSRQVDQR